MIANIWHFWIGVVLFFAGLLAVAGVVAGYLKSVTAQRYPGRRARRDD
jgi:formate-dependent nitrite reductase membrane component NrfD